jgi:4-carboxymuconolactone decarboxylase
VARMQFPAVADMTPEQKRAYDEAAAGPRGHAPAPMAAWIRNPELARRSQKIGEYIRFEISLPGRLRELAVLVVARYWSAHHEWRIHKKEALKHGLSDSIVKAITARRRPEFENEADRVVYDVANSMLEMRCVPDALYQEALKTLGEKELVELICVIGYYTYVSMTLGAFEIGQPENIQPELLNNIPDGEAFTETFNED